MKIAVLGTGFGAYHVELYKKIGLVKEIVVWGRNTEKLEELKEKFGVSTTTKCEEIRASALWIFACQTLCTRKWH